MQFDVATPELNCIELFKEAVRLLAETKPDMRMLEAGTLRWEEDFPTHHRSWFPDVKYYVMTDIGAGTDVDFTADIHKISEVTGENVYDAFIAMSVWEHIKQPWIAAREVAKILKPGGIFLIQTHSTFPLHGYPNDYYRFSTAALASLFEDTCDVIRTDFEVPAKIHCERVPNAVHHPTFLNSNIFGSKKRIYTL